MATVDECKGLDRAAIGWAGPFCPLAVASAITSGLDFASIGDAGPYYATEGVGGGPGGPSGTLTRVYPDMVRVYPPIGRVFPL